MFELKELLVALGLMVSPTSDVSDILIYKQKLAQELTTEKQISVELKQLEYKRIWEEANETEKTDFVNKYFKEKKANDKIIDLKKKQTLNKKRIKALKLIIEKDSLDKLPIQSVNL